MYVVTNGFSGLDSILVHIDSTDYITINSQIRKIQYGSGQSTYFWFGGPFVQGVGSLQSIIPQINVCDPMSGPLRCYEDTVLGLYNTGYRSSCDSLYVIFTSVDDIDAKKTEVNIYPNPFHESAVLIINAENIRGGYLEIRNTLGEVVDAGKYFSGKEIELKNNNFQSGIYFYRIITKENEFINGKFIVN